MADNEIRELLEQLRAALERLEARVARLEAEPHSGPPLAQSAPAPAAPRAASFAVTDYFAYLAIVCFVLLGALLLRIATDSGWLPPLVGVVLGLGYCALLLIGPAWLGKKNFFRKLSSALQICGLALVVALLIENNWRLGVLSTPVSAAVLLVYGAVALGLGGLQRRRRLMGMGLALPLAGLVGMGLSLETLLPRGVAAAGLCCLAVAVSAWRYWPDLRNAALVSVGVLLALAVLATGRRAGLPEAVGLGLIACVVAVWLAVFVNHLMALRGPAVIGAAWLPVASSWAFVLSAYGAPRSGSLAALAVGALMTSAGAWFGRPRPAGASRPAGFAGLVIAGGLLLTLGLIVQEPSGLGLALLAPVFLLAGRWLCSLSVEMLAQLMAAGAGVSILARNGLLEAPTGSVKLRLLVLLTSGGLLLTHYLLARCLESANEAKRARVVRSTATASLFLAVAAWFYSARLGLLLLFGRGGPNELFQSWMLAAFSAWAMLTGKRVASKPLVGVGLGAVGTLALKLMLIDFPALGGGYAAGAVAALGTASLAASIALRGSISGADGGHGGCQ